MKARFNPVLFSAVLAIFACANGSARAAEAPRRIVTLAPSLGELAADLAEDELSRIVGVSEYSDFPPALKKVASIGPYAHVNLEMVAALRPDLVLATEDGNSKEQVTHLKELGLPVVVVNTSTFAGIENSIIQVARAMGFEDRGKTMLASIERGLSRIDERARARRVSAKPRVILELGKDPLVVAGGGSFLNEALERVGAVNVYGDTSTHYPRPALEDAVKKDPDVIVITSMGDDSAETKAEIAAWSSFKNLKAVRNHKIVSVAADPLLRPTPRLLEGLSLLERAIYGVEK